MEAPEPHSFAKKPPTQESYESSEPLLFRNQSSSNELRGWLHSLLSTLHARRLKNQGFRKKGRTFSRDMGAYWERLNFQGSAQNYPSAAKWRFYVNVGVEFKDLPKQLRWSLFPNTHWAKRINQIIREANDVWEYDLETDQDQLIQSLASVIDRAGAEVASQIDEIRRQSIQ